MKKKTKLFYLKADEYPFMNNLTDRQIESETRQLESESYQNKPGSEDWMKKLIEM